MELQEIAAGVSEALQQGDPEDVPPNSTWGDRRQPRRRRWSPEEIEDLCELAVRESIPAIAIQLGRSPKSIRSKLVKLKPTDVLKGFKAKDLANTLKLTSRQIRRWRERGYLDAVAGRITESSLGRFCRTHPEKLPYASLDPGTRLWLRDLGYPEQ
jgi:hypothetical protein